MRPARRIFLLVVPLAACTPNAGVSGRWIGPLTATPPSPACPNTRGVAQVKANALIFTPDEGTWTLIGTVAPTGALTAARTRLGADKKPYTTTFTGTLVPEALTGTYTTPACTYAVQLSPR